MSVINLDKKPVSIKKHTISPMVIKDLPEVLSIEREAFPDPWSPAMFEAELSCNNSWMYIVHHIEENLSRIVAGYGGFRCISGTADIMNIAVHWMYRRLHIGSILMEYILDKLNNIGATDVFLEVRSDNYPAIMMYQKYEFKFHRIRKKYYRSDGSDALEMCLKR